jgi:hypothetical protein
MPDTSISGRVALGTGHFACSLEGLARERIQIAPSHVSHAAFRTTKETGASGRAAVLRDAFISLDHHRLHGYRAFDRINYRGKLKQHAVSRGLHEATPVFGYESVGDRAVFAERAGGADLVEAHQPRVARHVSGDYGR